MATMGVCYAIFWLYFLLFETFGGGRRAGHDDARFHFLAAGGGARWSPPAQRAEPA